MLLCLQIARACVLGLRRVYLCFVIHACPGTRQSDEERVQPLHISVHRYRLVVCYMLYVLDIIHVTCYMLHIMC